MEFFTNFFTLNTLAYALIGIPAFLGFAVLVRLNKQGRSSFQERHAAMDSRIQQTTAEVSELNKTMHREEQLHIIATALREALLLHPVPQAQVIEHADHVILQLTKQCFILYYREKKHTLRSTHKTVYGQGYFEVFGPLNLGDTTSLQEQMASQTGRPFYGLLELELYLTQRMKVMDTRKLPPALRPRI